MQRTLFFIKIQRYEKLVPPTVLGASSIAIREASSSTATTSATAATQANTGMLNGDPETTQKDFWGFFSEKKNYLSQRKSVEIPTFHCTALCHRAHTLRLQRLGGRQTPTANRA